MINNITLEQDYYAEMLGVEYINFSFEESCCQLTISEQHKNALGGTHGGLIFSLADIAFAAACNASKKGRYIGVQADIKYMRGSKRYSPKSHC